MANKNFIVKNGLTVGGVDIISSSGVLTQSLITAVPAATNASTQSVGNSSTLIATTAYVRGEIDALIDSAPGTLNTLDELAAAINDDAAFNTTLTDAVALKSPLASPTFTGNVGFPNNTIDRVHLAADIVDGTKIADDAIDSEHYVDGSIDAAHLAPAQTNITSVGTLTSFRSTGIDDNADALAITIDSSERVGIGATSPTSLLHVKGTSTHTYLTVEANSGVTNAIKFIGGNTWTIGADTTGGTPAGLNDNEWGIKDGSAIRLRIDSTGFVGIGTVVPGRILDIANSGGTETDVRITTFSTTNSHAPILTLRKSASDTIGTYTETTSGDCLGKIWFHGCDTGGSEEAGSGISAFQTGSATVSWLPSDLRFIVGSTTHGTVRYEAMRIDEAGNVGIGVTPTHKFNVSGAGTVESRFASTTGKSSLQISSDTDEGQDSELAFYSGTTARGSILYDHNTTQGTQAMQFRTGDNTQLGLQIANGKVGTGAGAGNIQSDLSVSGSDSAITMNIGTSMAAVGAWQGLAFGAYDTMKAGIFYERQSNYARGRLIFAVDDTADTSDATLADAAMYINRDKTVELVSHLNLSDNARVQFGAGSDLWIYHDGSNSRIRDVGDGGLYVGSSSAITFQDEDWAETYAIFNDNGAVVLYYDNAVKLATTSTGIAVTGSITSADKTVSASEPAATTNPSAIGHFWINTTSGEAYVCTDASNNANQWTNVGDGSGGKPFAGFDLMLAGGGGSGGSELRGGGGAGGLLYFTGFTGSVAYATSYTITIGAGGTPTTAAGNNGGNTTAFSETAGGGYGGGQSVGTGGGHSGTSAIVTSNYITANGWSYNGGSNAGNPGAGGAGSAANGETRPGGNGDGGYGGAGQYISNIYNGSDTYAWAGGGGGPGYGGSEDGGAGGLGGGGGGGVFGEGSPTGTPGTGGAGLNNGDAGTNENSADNGGDAGANTGSGGGGGSHRGGGESSSTGGPGGSGIVCIKQIQTEKAATTTGTVVKTTADGYRYYAFTGSGSITFNA